MKKSVLSLLVAGSVVFGFGAQATLVEEIGKIEIPSADESDQNGQWFLTIFSNEHGQWILDLVYEYVDENREDHVSSADQMRLRHITNPAIQDVTGYNWGQVDYYPHIKNAVKSQLQMRNHVLQNVEVKVEREQEREESGFLAAILKSAIPVVKEAVNNTLDDIGRIPYCNQYGEVDVSFCEKEV